MVAQVNSVMTHDKANFVRHESCPDCGSSDARASTMTDITSASLAKRIRQRNPVARAVKTQPVRWRTRQTVSENLLKRHVPSDTSKRTERGDNAQVRIWRHDT